MKWKLLDHVQLFVTLWHSPGQNTGVVSLSLLQGIFPTQGLNTGLLHCRQILCQLSHKGSPRILKWAAYPFFRGASWPRNWTRVSCIVGGFFINWAIREAQQEVRHKLVGTDTWRNAGAGCWSPSTGPGYNPLAKGRFLHVSKAAVSWQPGQW